MEDASKRKIGFYIFDIPFALFLSIFLGVILSVFFAFGACLVNDNHSLKLHQTNNLLQLSECDFIPIPGILPILILTIIFLLISYKIVSYRYQKLLTYTDPLNGAFFVLKSIFGVLLWIFFIVGLIYLISLLAEVSG